MAGKLNVSVECSPLLGPQLMAGREGREGRQDAAAAHRHRGRHLPDGSGRQGIPEAQVLRSRATRSGTPAMAVPSGRMACAHERRARALHASTAAAPVLDLSASASPSSACRRCRTSTAPVCRRGACADGPERRGQVHADQGADRRATRPTRARCAWTASRSGPRRRWHAQRAGHQHRVPGSQPLPQPLGGGEHLRRPLPAPRRGAGWRIDWAAHAPRRARSCWRALQPATSTSRDAARRATRWPCSRWWRSRARSSIDAQVLILDEPTSSLDDDEVRAPVRGVAPAARRGPGDPVRHPLPGPGVCRCPTASPCCATAAGGRVPGARAGRARR